MSLISESTPMVWRVFDIAVLLLGVWTVVQPFPKQSPEAVLGSWAQRLRLSANAVDVFRPILAAKARVPDYWRSVFRVIGLILVTCGGIGAVAPLSQPILFAVVCALSSVTFIVMLYTEPGSEPRRASLLQTPTESEVPLWIVLVFVALALVDAIIGTASAYAVAAATVICDSCLVALRLRPEFLARDNPVLEDEIDRQYRFGYLGCFVIWALVPSVILGATLTDTTWPTFFMKLTVSMVVLAAGVMITGARRRIDRDLQRSVESL